MIYKEYTAKPYEEKFHAGGLCGRPAAFVVSDVQIGALPNFKGPSGTSREMGCKQYDLVPELQFIPI